MLIGVYKYIFFSMVILYRLVVHASFQIHLYDDRMKMNRWVEVQIVTTIIHYFPLESHKVRNPIPLGYAGFYIVYS
jgi:hypothetical protein